MSLAEALSGEGHCRSHLWGSSGLHRPRDPLGATQAPAAAQRGARPPGDCACAVWGHACGARSAGRGGAARACALRGAGAERPSADCGARGLAGTAVGGVAGSAGRVAARQFSVGEAGRRGTMATTVSTQRGPVRLWAGRGAAGGLSARARAAAAAPGSGLRASQWAAGGVGGGSPLMPRARLLWAGEGRKRSCGSLG